MTLRPAPDYVPAHGLLRGKSVLVPAAAGAGIGFAAARRAAEEGCRALFVRRSLLRSERESLSQGLRAQAGRPGARGLGFPNERHDPSVEWRVRSMGLGEARDLAVEVVARGFVAAVLAASDAMPPFCTGIGRPPPSLPTCG